MSINFRPTHLARLEMVYIRYAGPREQSIQDSAKGSVTLLAGIYGPINSDSCAVLL